MRAEAKKKRKQRRKTERRKRTQCIGIDTGVDPTMWRRGAWDDVRWMRCRWGERGVGEEVE